MLAFRKIVPVAEVDVLPHLLDIRSREVELPVARKDWLIDIARAGRRRC